MKIVRSPYRVLGVALATAALSLPIAGRAQNSIYSIAASSVPSPPAGAALSMRLLNGTGGAYADNQIYWLIIGQDPNNGFRWSYVDGNGGMHPISAAMNDAAGHLTKNGANYANIDFPLVSGQWIGIPRITAARMYYSVGEPVYIKTFDNGFAGPDINNPADPNRNVTFDWSEFTIDAAGYHGNTTRVDMFGFPIQMRVTNVGGNFDMTTGELESQTRNGIISAYQSYVPAEFQSLATVQAPYRIVAPLHGSFAAGQPNGNYFSSYTTQYTTQEIMGASGNLANNSPVDASINRHVWNLPQAQWGDPANFYKASPANWYAAFWHTVAIGGLAYGMPYDDYANQSSYVSVGDPKGVMFRIAWNTPVTSGDITNAGYSVVASENQTVNFSTPVDDAYGANGSYFFRYAAKGNVTFSNAAWGGDPIFGVAKFGYAKPFTKSAAEGGSATFSVPVEAAYGANGAYYFNWGTSGTVTFTNAAWGGDPIANVAKSGYFMPYTQCANENGTVTFNSPTDLAYGANGHYSFRHAFTGTITFNNATFGDPIAGTAKAGYYRPSH